MSFSTTTTIVAGFLVLIGLIGILGPQTNITTQDSLFTESRSQQLISSPLTMASTSGDTYPGSGDWIINQPTSYINETLTVYGDIIINNPGSLLLKNTSINFAPSGSSSTIKAWNSTTLNIVNSHLYSTTKSFSIVYTNMAAGNINGSLIENLNRISIGGTTSGGLYYTTIAKNTFRNYTGNSATLIDATYARFGCVNISFNVFDGSYHSGTSVPTKFISVGNGDSNAMIIQGNVFHDCYVDGTNSYTSIIEVGVSARSTIIMDNNFTNIGNSSKSAYPIIFDRGYLTQISNNEIHNSWATGIMIQPINGHVSNATIMNNEFSHLSGRYNTYFGTDSVPVIYIDGNGPVNPALSQNIIIQGNSFLFVAGTAIHLEGQHIFNITIKNNLIGQPGMFGFRLIDHAANVTITGNIVISAQVGIGISATSMNNTIYNNAFMYCSQTAFDFNHTNTIWDNGTIGNLWDTYDGSDSNNDWFGDSAFAVDGAGGNITDNHPVYKIGELPPGSGDWVISTPHAYWNHTFTVPGKISLSGSGASFVTEKMTATLGGDIVGVSHSWVVFTESILTVPASGLDIVTHDIIAISGTNVTAGLLTVDPNSRKILLEDSAFDSGLTLNHVIDTRVDNVEVTGDYFSLNNSHNVSIVESTVRDKGLKVSYSNLTAINTNSFGASTIRLSNSHNGSITNSTFEDFYDSNDFNAQITLFYSDYGNISENTFENTTTAIKNYRSTLANIIDNQFHLYDGYGVVLESGGTEFALIKNNEFYGGLSGVYSFLSDSHNTTITGNTIHDVDDYGIHCTGGNNLVITNNTIYSISGNGIDVWEGGHAANISDNTIYNVTGNGIISKVYDNSRIMRNSIHDSGIDGIHLLMDGANGLYMADNIVHNSGNDGIEIDNTLNGAVLYNNSIHDNGGWGFNLFRPQGCTAYLNWLYSNARGNVWLGWGSGNQFDNGTYGNFYDDYTGVEGATPWIGATSWNLYGANHGIGGIDHYPIMGMGSLPPDSGDWTIDSTTILLRVTKTITGNVNILGTGNLTLVGTHLIFGSSTLQTLSVQNGGSFQITQGALVDSSDHTNSYDVVFYSGSTFVFRDSTMSWCGWGASRSGLTITIPSATIENVTVSNADVGLYIDNVAVNVSELTANNCTTGIILNSVNGATISNAHFDDVDTGIQLTGSTNCIIEYSNFTGTNNYGLLINSASSLNIIRFNSFKGITSGSSVALDIAGDSNTVYLNLFWNNNKHITNTGSGNMFNNGTFGNVYWDYSGVDADGDLIGDTPYNTPALSDVIDTKPTMVWGDLPTGTAWNIHTTTFVFATNYTLSGDLMVYGDGYMRAMSATIWFNCSSDQEYGLTISDAGRVLFEQSTFRAVNNSYRFSALAETGSFVELTHSTFIGMYWFEIKTNDTYVTDMTVQNSYAALYFHGTNSLRISGITVNGITGTNLEAYVIYAVYSEGMIFNNIAAQHITRFAAVAIQDSGDVTLADGQFSDVPYILTEHWPFLGATLMIHNINATDVDGGFSIYDVLSNVTIYDCDIALSGTGTMAHFQDVAWFHIYDSHGFNGSNGVFIRNADGLIGNMNLDNFTDAIRIYIDESSHSTTVSHVDFYGCTHGVSMSQVFNPSAAIEIYDSTFSYCDYAAYYVKSNNFMFGRNTVTDASYGVHVRLYGIGSHLFNNTYERCGYAISLQSNQHDFIIENETLIDCPTGIYINTMDNLTISNTLIEGYTIYGAFIRESDNTTLTNVTLRNGNIAIEFYHTTHVTMTYCEIENSTDALNFNNAGVDNIDEANHTIDTSNKYEGKPIYYFFNRDHETIADLDTYALYVFYCDRITITNVTVGDRLEFLHLYSLSNSTLANSTIHTSVWMDDVSNVIFFGNTFEAANTIHVRRVSATNVTFTRNGFLSTYSISYDFNLNDTEYGNYWYDYTGTDSNNDGIGDTPHELASGYYDYLPLMVNPRGFGVDIVILSPADGTHLSHSATINVNVTVTKGILYEGSISVSTVINFNQSQAGSGMDGLITINFDTTTLGDGLYILNVKSTVNSVSEFSQEITVFIDNTAPIITHGIAEVSYTSASTAVQSIYVEDTASRVKWIAVWVNGTLKTNVTRDDPHSDFTYTLSMPTDGRYILLYQAGDGAGNVANSTTITVFRDKTSPTLSQPEDVTYTFGSTGNSITWDASDLTPRCYNVSIDGTNVINAEWNGSTIVVSVDGLTVGDHSIYLVVYDQVGNMNDDFVTVHVLGSTTSTTTTTGTSTTTTTPTTTSSPSPPDGGVMTIILVAVAGAMVIVVVIIVLRMKGAIGSGK